MIGKCINFFSKNYNFFLIHYIIFSIAFFVNYVRFSEPLNSFYSLLDLFGRPPKSESEVDVFEVVN